MRGSSRESPGVRQAIVEVVEACISPCDQAFGDANARRWNGSYLRLDHVRQPSFGVADIDDCVGTVIDDGLFRNTDSLCSVNQARASLWREKLDGAKAALGAERISSWQAAPQHHVHPCKNLPGKLRRRRWLEAKSRDELEEKMGVDCMITSAAHLVPVIGGHLELDLTACTDLRQCYEIIESCFTGTFHSEKPFQLMSLSFARNETIEIMFI